MWSGDARLPRLLELGQPVAQKLQAAGPDIVIQAAEIQRNKQSLNEILGKHTGRTPEKIATDADRDYYMSATEAAAYGLVDEVVEAVYTKGS